MVDVAISMYGLKIEAKKLDLSRVTGYLAKRIEYLKGWCSQSPAEFDCDVQGAIPIATLRERLAGAPVLKEPKQLSVEGALFPAVLLYSGWWERERGKPARAPKWHDDLQAWLFTGFEQWGPSWDFNPGAAEADHYLFGQIGEGDEANSLPVIVPPSKATRLREKLHEGAQVFGVKATGLLCHRQHIQDPALRQQIARWGRSFDYCFLLSAEERTHRISPVRSRPEMYSGYLWQCWAPRKWVKTAGVEGMDAAVIDPPRLNKIYFLWEHTDFTKPDAVAYNLDSLHRKMEYLKERHGDLVLLQKSSELVPGKAVLSRSVFYEYIMEMPPP